MKTLIAMITLLAGFAAQANSTFTLQCEINEVQMGKQSQQVLELAGTDDPHGTVQSFALQSFEGFSGMVALMGTNVVIHLYDEKTGYAFSTHSDITGTGMAYYQLIMPTRDVARLEMVSVTCLRKN